MLKKMPLYQVLADKFEKKISDGSWAKGDKLPSERDLSRQYNVSRITVRAAIEELSRVGMLESIHGKGNFVVSKKIVQELNSMYSFSDEMRKEGLKYKSKVIAKEVLTANKRLARKLNIDIDSKIIYLKRIRYNEKNKPILIEKSYFPFNKYHFILEENLDDLSMHALLEKKYNIFFDNAVEKFKVCKLNKSELSDFESSTSEVDFGMLIRRTTYSENKIEYYSNIVTYGDIYEFVIKLGVR